MKRLFLLLIVITLPVSAFTQNRVSAKEGLKVNGIGLGATYSSVIKRFGKPVKVVNADAGECVGGIQRTIEYPGLKFILYEDDKHRFTVGEFEVTSARWEVSGVKVGMTEAAITRRFGKADAAETDSERNMPVWYFNLNDEVGPGNTNFYFKNGKVDSIYSLYMMC